jgi:hypothetical protein
VIESDTQRVTAGDKPRVSSHRGVPIATIRARAIALATIACVVAACADITTSPTAAASIELVRDHAPAIVLGDSLRDANDQVVPVRATVRNLKGDILAGAFPHYVYADGARDTSVFVDSLTGYVVLLKPLDSLLVGITKTPSSTVRIAARYGNSLIVFDTVFVTPRPDSVDRNGATTVDTLTPALPDTVTGNARNTSIALSVAVRHIDSLSVATTVPKWLVKFELVQPANPSNDSLKGVYLVNDNGFASVLDTTDGSGNAARYVRVRPSIFPSGTPTDSVVVRATVTFKGQNVKGSPILISVPVKKAS